MAFKLTTKQWLQRAWNIEKEIRDLCERKKKVFEDLTRATPSYDARAGGSSADSGGKYIKLVEFTRRIEEKTDLLYDIKCEIDEAIEQVSDARLRRLLKLRYIDFNTWEKIAEKMNYDLRWVHRLHKKALQTIESH